MTGRFEEIFTELITFRVRIFVVKTNLEFDFKFRDYVKGLAIKQDKTCASSTKITKTDKDALSDGQGARLVVLLHFDK